MKNKFEIGFLGLLVMACQQNDPMNSDGERDNYIRFSTPTIIVETNTRSVTQNALEIGDCFGVLGYCVPYMVGTTTLQYQSGTSPWSTKYKQCPPNIFYKEPVIVKDGFCSYDNPKQWYRNNKDIDGSENSNVVEADDYRYTFFAYYPYSDTNPVFHIDTPATQEIAGAPKITFTMPQSGNEIGTSLDHSKTPDAMFGVLYNHQKTQGNLAFNFSHLLTALGFEVNNFSDYELKVHSITLRGKFFKEILLDFSQTGVLTYSFPESYYTGSYTIFSEEQNNGKPLVLSAPETGVDRTTSALLPKNNQGEGEHILLISGKAPYFGPETGNLDENMNIVHVYIDYTFNNLRKNFSSARPATFTPQPGTKYTAQLNFVGNAFVLQFVVANNEKWENGGSDDDPGIDNEEDGNGDVIFE